MAGKPLEKNLLNKTLVIVADALNLHLGNKWFIGYGTLLGIHRDNSCIKDDDDVDILIDIKDREKTIKILKDAGFKLKPAFVYGIRSILKDMFGYKKRIIQTISTDTLASVDIYLCDIDSQGNYLDEWNRVIWNNCFINGKLIEKKWNGTVLLLPYNYESKLTARYGNWKIPSSNKCDGDSIGNLP